MFFIAAFATYSQEWTQNNKLTKVTFKIKNFGVNVDGDFSNVKISTNFNPKNLSESYINATIAVKSISTGIKGRDKHILEEDYFDEPNHKNIVLKSSKIQKNSDGSYTMTGELTLKNTTKKVEIPLEITEDDEKIMIQSKFTINRKDYKVGGGSFIMSKTVKIQVEFTGTK